MTAGLVFLAPATHPWPGGVAWYYHLAAMPLIGPLFANTLALPAGMSMLEMGTKCVFAPNPRPDDYIAETGPAMVLRPSEFRANAIDIARLNTYARRASPRYIGIEAPTVVISGDSDPVVRADIHSTGLERDIPGAELVWVKNLGHKPDYVTPELVVAAIEKVAGLPRDLKALALEANGRLAGDRATCP